MNEIKMIPVDKLYPHPDNPRKELGDLTELADSIKANGILQNLTVVRGHAATSDDWKKLSTAYAQNPTEELRNKMNAARNGHYYIDSGYTVVIGHRRLAASKLAEVEQAPCVIAEMDLKEQRITMLMENMQRSDLTVYEQAKGFQMMLDMGESIADVSEKSGFSQSTVRRRVKLLELDEKQFKKAESRGGRIEDYIKLEEIEDKNAKNAVLKTIGTANFNNALREALEKQKTQKRIDQWLEVIKTFAEEDAAASYQTKQYVRCYTKWNLEADVVIPEDADTVKYYYKVTPGKEIDIYEDKDLEKEAAEKARNEERERLKKAKEKSFQDVAKRHYELRRAFVKNIPQRICKLKFPIIARFTAKSLISNHYPYEDYEKNICELLGIKKPKTKDTENFLDTQEIKAFFADKAEKALLIFAYYQEDSENENYYNYNCAYRENKELNNLYDFLVALGYEMSDEEKAMQNGTHELFEEAVDAV